MNTITVSELRGNLKEILEQVKNGKVYQITQRGEIIVSLTKAETISDGYEDRIAAYRNGGIRIENDIISAPLKDLDYISDTEYSLDSDYDIAAESDA